MRLRLIQITMEEGIYYKRGSKSDFAAVDMLPGGQDIPRIVIEKITFHETMTINGRKETEIFTAKFAQNPWCNKEFVLNSTNKARIAKQHWNDTVEDGTICEGRINLLKNIAVRLTKEEARDVQNGGTTFGLRISKIPPASEQEMQQWMAAHGYAPAGNTPAASAPASRKPLPMDKVDLVVDWAQKKGLKMDDVEKVYEMSAEVKALVVSKLEDLPYE